MHLIEKLLYENGMLNNFCSMISSKDKCNSNIFPKNTEGEKFLKLLIFGKFLTNYYFDISQRVACKNYKI